jgi:hypothetical protein
MHVEETNIGTPMQTQREINRMQFRVAIRECYDCQRIAQQHPEREDDAELSTSLGSKGNDRIGPPSPIEIGDCEAGCDDDHRM